MSARPESKRAWDRAHPRPESKRAWDRAHRGACERCGDPCDHRARCCERCARAAVAAQTFKRRVAILQAWNAGASVQAIAEQLASTPRSILVEIDRMRKRGFDVRYRRPRRHPLSPVSRAAAQRPADTSTGHAPPSCADEERPVSTATPRGASLPASRAGCPGAPR